MSKAEELQQKLNELQAELDALKEEEKKEPLKAMLPKEGRWYLSANKFRPVDNFGIISTEEEKDDNVFPDKETAEAYAEAFRVMLELRRQPGSGQLDDEEEVGWIIECGGVADWYSDERNFALCPPFSSEELAQKAAEAVGIERIKKAYATLSNIKGE